MQKETTGILDRCKKGGWEPQGSPEAKSEESLAVLPVWLRCGPPSWVQVGGGGSWEKHDSLKQVGSRGQEPGPSLFFLTASSKFPVKGRLRIA